MSQFALESFGAYKKARELFDLVVQDTAEMKKDPRCYRLVAQQVASADSICANIEEGHGRLSRARSSQGDPRCSRADRGSAHCAG